MFSFPNVRLVKGGSVASDAPPEEERPCFPASYDAALFRLPDTDGSAVVQVGRANFTETQVSLNRLAVQHNQTLADRGNPFVLWLRLCSYIYKNAAVILCAAV